MTRMGRMTHSAENDRPEVEWIVALRMPPHNVGGLSLHQCSTCFALVVEDFLPEHLDWHTRVTPSEVTA